MPFLPISDAEIVRHAEDGAPYPDAVPLGRARRPRRAEHPFETFKRLSGLAFRPGTIQPPLVVNPPISSYTTSTICSE